MLSDTIIHLLYHLHFTNTKQVWKWYDCGTGGITIAIHITGTNGNYVKTPLVTDKQRTEGVYRWRPQGDSNPCCRDENPVS